MKFTIFVSLYFPAIACMNVHVSPCWACKMNIWQSVVFYCFKYHGDWVQWINNGACSGQTQLWKLFPKLLLMRFDYNMTDFMQVSSNFCPSSLVNYAIFFVIFLFINVTSMWWLETMSNGVSRSFTTPNVVPELHQNRNFILLCTNTK